MLTDILQEIALGPESPSEPCPDPARLREAFEVIMRGDAKPAQVAALLMGLRCRGERPEHLKAAIDVMLEHSVPLPLAPNRPVLVDTCGPGGIGRSTVNVSTATALLAATAGVPVAKHGNRSITSRSGSADALEALGFKLDCAPETSARLLEKHNFCFLFAPAYHPAMKHAGPIRRELSIRTIFNLAGPLSNPARPTHQLLGVGTRELLGLMAETLRLIGRKRALIVHGRDGSDEISLSQVTEGLHLREDGSFEDFILSPHDLDLHPQDRESLVIESPQESAAVIRRVLAGEPGPVADEINVNVAAVLWLADRAIDIKHGFNMAREVQQSGAGLKLLNAIVEECNQ